MSILTFSGRTAMVEALLEQPIHMAWGLGDPAWGDLAPPAESPDATALLSEVGRRDVLEKRYVLPDDNGDIIVPNGKFSFSNTPTRYAYFSFKMDFGDAAGQVIREIAVYTNSEMDSSLPAGQKYFTGAEITNPGILLSIEHITPVHRSMASRETFDFVVSL